MNQTNSVGTPTELTAGLTPQQLGLFNQVFGYGSSNNTAANEGALSGSAAGSGLSGAQGALAGLGGFNAANTNNINADIAAGNAYGAGANIPAQVKAAMRDANQEAMDVTLPGMEQSAAGSGNINSSRTGVAEGIVQRGLAQQAGDLSAQLAAQYYNTGAGLASNQNTANNTANLGALTGAGALGNSMFGSGLGGLSNSISDQGSLYNLANNAAAGIQTGNQLNDTNAAQLYAQNTQAPFNGLNQYWNIVGSNNWGGTSTSTGSTNQQSTPSLMSTIGSLMGAGGSMMGSRAGAFGGGSGLLGLFA